MHGAKRCITAELAFGAVTIVVADVHRSVFRSAEEHDPVRPDAGSPGADRPNFLRGLEITSGLGVDVKKDEVVARATHLIEGPAGFRHTRLSRPTDGAAISSHPPQQTPQTEPPYHPHRFSHDFLRHFARAFRAIEEDNRNLDNPKAFAPGAESHLDLKRVAVGPNVVEID